MTKKRSRKDIYSDYAKAIGAIRKGEPVKRTSAKDGSISTHPAPLFGKSDQSEAEVLQECLSWLRARQLVCNRNNVGVGAMSTSGMHSYGIKGAGDIIGLLKNGRHFEVECKAGKGGRLSKGQQQRRYDVMMSNGLYLVVHSLKELRFHFERLI